MAFLYTAEQWLPYPVDLVFAFFANPDNLPRLMPAWQDARIEEATIAAAPPHPDPARRIPGPAAGAGTRLTLSFRAVPLSPIRLPWDAEISEFEWNDHFCDIQRKRGPFKSWRHCHSLRMEPQPDAAGVPTVGTAVRDEVQYEVPLGLLGVLAQPFIALQLRSTFNYRHRKTAELLRLMTAG